MYSQHITISRNGDLVLIIDTKRKRLKGAIDDTAAGVGLADGYQMMAYAQVYRCKRVMLLYPHHEGIGLNEGLLSSHRISGTDDARIIKQRPCRSLSAWVTVAAVGHWPIYSVTSAKSPLMRSG